MAVRNCSGIFISRPTFPIDQKGTGLIVTTPEQSCSTPAVPTPPQEPKFPEVTVDLTWQAEAEKAQEEAAAIWEELRHRAGGYTRFFDVPLNYNARNSHISDMATSLEKSANKLH